MSSIQNDLQNLHQCVVKRRECLDDLNTQIVVKRAEELVLVESIRMKQRRLEELEGQEKKEHQLKISEKLRAISEQLQDLSTTAESTQDQMEGIENDISCLRDEAVEMEEAVGRRVRQRRQ